MEMDKEIICLLVGLHNSEQLPPSDVRMTHGQFRLAAMQNLIEKAGSLRCSC
jgi:hypothetical protein